MMNVLLSENHRRVLSSAFYMIEKTLSELDSEIRQSERTTIVKKAADLSENEQKKYVDNFKTIIALVRRLSEKYNLSLADCTLRQKILSGKMIMWEILCETNANKLEQYGAISKNIGREIDLDITNLMELIERI